MSETFAEWFQTETEEEDAVISKKRLNYPNPRHPNRGFMYERTQYTEQGFGDLEKAFADTWEAENKKVSGWNQGLGILQDLFFRGHNCVHEVTRMERWVAATVVQWLGTNCGFCFLRNVLKKCGYGIVRLDEYEERRRWDQISRERAEKLKHERAERIRKSPSPWCKRMIDI